MAILSSTLSQMFYKNCSRSPARSHHAPRVLWAMSLCGLMVAGTAQAQSRTLRATAGSLGSRGKHCLDEQKRKLLLEHFMGGSINPLGIVPIGPILDFNAPHDRERLGMREIRGT